MIEIRIQPGPRTRCRRSAEGLYTTGIYRMNSDLNAKMPRDKPRNRRDNQPARGVPLGLVLRVEGRRARGQVSVLRYRELL
jgi:hypothetical protein